MSLTFPNSPSTNDTHTTGGSTWKFDGEKWVRQGTTGPQGIQGVLGRQGLQGLANQGVQGLQGLKGSDGSVGSNGSNGSQGVQGVQGLQGLKGDDGSAGSNGSNGSQGIAGSDGSSGSNGAQGTQGSAGSNGSNGSNGAQGTAGAQGAIGPDGGNAGTLDGLDSTAFLRSNAADTTTGDLTISTSGSPTFTVETSATSGQDALIKIAGARTSCNSCDIGMIEFRNDTSSASAMAQISAMDPSGSHTSQNGELVFRTSSGGTLSDQLVISNTGDITVSGDVTANSDIKLKKNINTIDNALDKVLNLRGVEFDYIANDKHSIGVIAQEVEEVLPDLIHTDENTDTKSVAYGNLTAVLIEAVKELKKENDALSARIKSLEDR